ncbi:uncharacterized protein LOC123199857 isoform X2 [Mangifera indica]|uniref:uncharacterized protein LOC123199857 isoform X2 n=2 Tax=Mangifera indica TaxID=29780 RepID=UPI001CFB249D|nr:uncharacterized protein LOC123199857 isoform X2 [Mangifera indica]
MPSSASFQNLKFLNVYGVDGLVALTTPSVARSLVQLRELKLSFCEILVEIIENEGDATTSSKIVFDNLKLLYLTQLQCLTCFCSGNYSFNFSLLEELTIEECPNLKTFSQGMLSTPKLRKVNYEGLVIENEGNDLNKIIHGLCKKKGEEISVDVKYKAFRDDNSTKICYDQHPTSFYQNLTCLMIWNCGNIKYAFPPSIAKSFHQLQQLVISDCKALKEIVAKEGKNVVVNFVFPNLTLLKLQNLPELTVFYPEIHTSEWPKLEELVVGNCAKYLSFKENNEEIEFNILDPKSIFLEDKINSHLEIFELWNASAKFTWKKQSKSLYISKDESAYIPLGPLQRFQNLKELKLISCNYRGIKRLLDLQSLEVLDLWNCEMLLSPLLSTPFQNLKVLKVKCHSEFFHLFTPSMAGNFFNLITPSTARNLVQLRELSISSCDTLFEIVENEGDATFSSEQVVFNNLNKLSLKNLGLSFFCSGNYSFNFPSLEELIIKFCPKMKYFCPGMLSTPMLHKINYEGMEVENEGNDLNSTMQQAHKEKIVQSYGKDSHGSKLQSHMVSVKKRTLKCIADYIVDVTCKPAGLSHNYGAIFIVLFSIIPWRSVALCGSPLHRPSFFP